MAIDGCALHFAKIDDGLVRTNDGEMATIQPQCVFAEGRMLHTPHDDRKCHDRRHNDDDPEKRTTRQKIWQQQIENDEH